MTNSFAGIMILNIIYWNVDPEIITLGSFGLRWYSLLFAAGFVIGYYIMKRMFLHEKINLKWLDSLLMYLILGTIIGARLGHCLFYDFEYYSQHPLEIFLPVAFEPSFHFTGFQGLASHGGAIGNIIALWLFSRRISKKPVLWILDRVVVPVALAGMFIRLGNLMNSEIIGLPTDVPWAFVFERVDDLARHPVQLYEAIAYLGLFLLLHRLYWKTEIRTQSGKLFGWFLAILFFARFILEYFKHSQGGFESALGNVLTTGQWLSIPFILVGLYFAMRKK